MSKLHPPLNLPFPHNSYHGMALPVFVTPERLLHLRDNHKAQPRDVCLVTYPKSGTTWLSYILHQLHDKPKLTSLDDAVPWITTLPPSVVEELSAPRIFRLHLLHDWLPESITKETKIIYCYRNPKDVSVSYFHHTKFFKQIYDGFEFESFDEFFQHYMSNNPLHYGTWIQHVRNWLPHRNDPNVLFVSYEDMVEELPRVIRQIAKFLEVSVSEERVDEIANNSSFSSMKKDDRLNRKDLGENIVDMKKDFIRKGKVGDWKNTLTENQARVLDELCSTLPDDFKVRFEL